MDELTGQMLLEYWGGGYEVIYREAGNGLVYLKDYTIMFWALDLEDRDSEIRPGGLHQVRAARGFLVTDVPTARACSRRRRSPTSVLRGEVSRSKGRTGNTSIPTCT